jgi:hypothetical protein
MDDNRPVWMLNVNDLMVDLKHTAKEVKTIAFNAA